MEPSQPTRETITKRTLALPHVDSEALIDEPEALAFWEELRKNNPSLYGHLNDQISRLDESIAAHVGNAIDPRLRRGIIARAAIASAAQVVNDTGQSIIDIRAMAALFGTEEAGPTDNAAER